MDMYDGLAEAYDEIFPVNPATLARLEALGVGPGSRALDVGCATGSHAIELARRGVSALGVDPAEALVARARARAAEAFPAGSFPPGAVPPRFGVAGMLDFARFAGAGPFDALLCLGNTLPHLGSAAELASFLEAAAAALEGGGLLLLQLLDYGTLTATRPERLAPIETARWRFERSLRWTDDGRVEFSTRLSSRDGTLAREGSTLLTPFTPPMIASSLAAAGFGDVEPRGGWSGKPFQPGVDPVVVIEARKEARAP